MSNELKNIIEAVLLVSDSPVSVSKIQGLFEEDAQPETSDIKEAIALLQEDCEERGIELKKIGSGYRYQSKTKYANWIRKLYAARPPRMSRALLETLAIIAYRQPVTRGDIEEVRGVSVSADIMQKLQEREWVKQIGVRDVPGRPALFGTTPEFLSYFNLESLKELPELMQERELGDIAKELENPLPPEVLAALEQKEQQDVFGDGTLAKAGDPDDEQEVSESEIQSSEQESEQSDSISEQKEDPDRSDHIEEELPTVDSEVAGP